jgi:GTPase SAR1 family protein
VLCGRDIGELGLSSHDIAGIDQYLTLNDLFIRESDGFVLCFRWATPRRVDRERRLVDTR